jgi:hypothetical protein
MYHRISGSSKDSSRSRATRHNFLMITANARLYLAIHFICPTIFANPRRGSAPATPGAQRYGKGAMAGLGVTVIAFALP